MSEHISVTLSGGNTSAENTAIKLMVWNRLDGDTRPADESTITDAQISEVYEALGLLQVRKDEARAFKANGNYTF